MPICKKHGQSYSTTCPDCTAAKHNTRCQTPIVVDQYQWCYTQHPANGALTALIEKERKEQNK